MYVASISKKDLWQMLFTPNVLLWVPSIDSRPCSHWARGVKVLFPGGYGEWSSYDEFYLLLGKELEGKQIHQNVQKHHISGGRNKN